MTLLAEHIDQNASPDSKITLFRSLFRGRDDVYPLRFESRRTGKAGYQPACANEWVLGICEKPKIKCAACPHRRLLPVTDDVIRRHLSGYDEAGKAFVMGVYPMLLDETCFFLAVDFDKKQWREDAASFMETSDRLGVPVALERSRSGNGGHVWLFFEEAVPAGFARRLGSHILTETMECRPEIGLDSYDRFFPNQDTLPQGGFGNLIALPLQHRPRSQGNSVFIDRNCAPYTDQWAFLSQVQKITRHRVEEIVHNAERKGRVVGVRLALDDDGETAPWTAPPSRRRMEIPIREPLPSRLELILADGIYVTKSLLPPVLRNRLLRLAAFQNPEFYKAQAMRLPTYDKPRVIACAEEYADHLCLPRGCLDDLLRLLSDLKIDPFIRDERGHGSPLEVTFQGKLRPDQQMAADAMLKSEMGVLSATTAFGKTVVAAWLIAQRRVSTLILVHRRQLLEQWIERLSTFLGIKKKDIGRIGGGRKAPTHVLDVALIQSLVRKGVVSDQVGEYGHLVVDECHHLPAFSFEQVARRAKAKYIIGLSATVTRKDGHHPIVFMQCGPIRYHVDAKQQAATRPFEHTVVVRPTGFLPAAPADLEVRRQFHDLYDELQTDEARNGIICEDVIQVVKEGRSPIVLTERNRHLDFLANMLAQRVEHVIVLRGGMRKKDADAATERLASIPHTQERILLATGRYIGEGFDDARLDTLFLTLPVSWRGTIAQYVGRLHRLHDSKHEVRVYDYADVHVPMLARMFERRCKGYERVGYTISLPASAIPGWPAEVPLPVDPAWKSRYSSSVRRLANDGLGVPLANLFAATTQSLSPDAKGVARARSTAEAFLYHRLETLPETTGLFQLNADLPIAFDGKGRMEVDLHCPSLHIVIEIDGAQHLADAHAYRRDRRKDVLLQEDGYFVLRFLAEDVSKNLDRVLDTILRTLAHQQHR